MKNQLPHAELAYRDWLSVSHDVYDIFMSHLPLFAETMGMKEIPAQVALPGSIPWTYYDKVMREVFHERLTSEAVDEGWVSACFYAGYERTRRTYYVEDELVDLIGDLPFPDGTPAAALLHLPLPAFAMEIRGQTYCVFYDLLTGEESSGQLEIRVAILKNRRVFPHSIFHLREDATLQEAVDSGVNKILEAQRQGVEELRRQGKNPDLYRHRTSIGGVDMAPEEAVKEMKANAREVVNILLYMAGEDDIVDIVGHEMPKAAKRHRRALGGTAHEGRLSERPKESAVGLRVKNALIRYKDEQKKEHEASGDKRPFSPRVVPPHPQLYHTGPGRQVPKVRYKAMYFAGGEAEIKPSVQRVG